MYEPNSPGSTLDAGSDPISKARIGDGPLIGVQRRRSQAARTTGGPERSGLAARRSPLPAASSPITCAATATLDKLNRGVLLIRSDGRIAFRNRTARAMLTRQDGLRAPGGRLEFLQRSAQAQFDAFLRRRADADGEASLVLVAGGPGQRGAYQVLVSPLDLGVETEGPSHCVFIYEPDAGRRELPNKVLAQLYGLTAGEARLTNQLFVGNSLRVAATALGITTNTARSQLKRIFNKCSVGSQAELLQLLSLGPRTL
jgi:DNA-binding CsgD family transcriptional regulator